MKDQDLGAAKSRGGALTDLDELFVAHGFFVNGNGNADAWDGTIYDPPEEVGRGADRARPTRRNLEPSPGSFIAFQARDAQTGALVQVEEFTVEVRYPAPREHWSYSFTQKPTDTGGRLFFFGADPKSPVTTYITARGPGHISTAPLAVTNTAYWQAMAMQPTDSFLEHTFQMRPVTRAYLPSLVKEAQVGTGSPLAAAPAAPVQAAPRQTLSCTGGP